MRRITAKLIPLLLITLMWGCGEKPKIDRRPNILFAISDDQSFSHTSFAGCSFVNTPAFDRIASEGIYFTNCYAGSPGCAPSRSAIVTGRHHWQNEQSGQHASSWMKKFVPFVDELKSNGYSVGRTGKGVGPFQYARNKNDSLWRIENAAGSAYDVFTYDSTYNERFASGISNINYAANFKYFIDSIRNGDEPFFYWYGSKEPHRKFEEGSWERMDKKLEDVDVPDFLPDNDVIRGDLLDYAVEIEWFDLHLQRMLEYLESIGELDNTIVIVTSDNGMSFPRAKANCYDYGIHVPMAIRYPKEIEGGGIIKSMVSFIDLAPTILEASKITASLMLPITGKSIWKMLTEGQEDKERMVFAGRERHSSSRFMNWGYPQRSVRKGDYLLTWNVFPDRWPAGAPQGIDMETGQLNPLFDLFGEEDRIGENIFSDIDQAPSKKILIKNYEDEEIQKYLMLACEKRPEFEMFNVAKDMECLVNLAGKTEYKEIEEQMKWVLFDELKKTNDYRVSEAGFDTFDSYERYSPMRAFPEPVGKTLKDYLKE